MNNRKAFMKLYSFHGDMDIFGRIANKYCKPDITNVTTVYYNNIFRQKDFFNSNSLFILDYLKNYKSIYI